LAKLYPFLGSAKGEEYLALSKTIGKLERDVASNTGESPAAVRERLGKPVAVTFQVVLNADTDSPIRVTGGAGEVGGGDERRAVPTRKTKPNTFVSAPIEFVAQRGKTVELFVLNGMTKQAFTYRLTLPDRPAVTAKLHNRGTVTLT
jgi:hypothetical protein